MHQCRFSQSCNTKYMTEFPCLLLPFCLKLLYIQSQLWISLVILLFIPIKILSFVGLSLFQRIRKCKRHIFCYPQIIAKAKGLNWREIRSFGELHKKLGLSLQEMLAVVEEILHQHPYEKKEVCQILGVTDEELNKESLSANTLDGEYLKTVS